MSRRIEQDMKGMIIKCANGGMPYTESNITGNSYCWIFPQGNGDWSVSEEILVGIDGVIVTLDKKLPPGGEIEIEQSFCGTAFAKVL